MYSLVTLVAANVLRIENLRHGSREIIGDDVKFNDSDACTDIDISLIQN